MAEFKKPAVFPRNEHVDIHVRRGILNPDAPESERVEVLDIREFIKSGEIYGHGLVLPLRNKADLVTALDQATR